MKTPSIFMRSWIALIISAASSASAQVLSWSAVSAGGSGDPESFFESEKAMVVDGDGNIYVTGSSSNEFNRDFLTVKFAADGRVLWSARYNGPDNDYANALALTPDGDVVVTGSTTNIHPWLTDYATVKYDGTTGAQIWVSRYARPGRSDDGNAVAITSTGDVVVTGSSAGDNGDNDDYLTVKYNGATGAEQWVSRYDGSAHYDDYAWSLAITSTDDVVVTGSSERGSGDRDFVTVKYNGMTGAEQWASRYSSSIDNGYDNVTEVTITGSDDVVVAGRTYSQGVPSSATVKYAGNTGIELWVARGHSGDSRLVDITSLVTTSAGDVVVTGSSTGQSSDVDYTTVKYAGATGAEQWVTRYDGPDHRDDHALAVALDPIGNVLVTGLSRTIANGFDYVTLKYSGVTGAELWSAASVYNGPFNTDDKAYAIAVDAAGDVVVAGKSVGAGITTELPGSYDYRVVKYTGTNGALQWSSSEPNIEGLTEQMTCGYSLFGKGAAAVDTAGNTYVTGCALRVRSFDFVTTKFAPDGSLLWSSTYSGPDGGTQKADALAIADNGDVVVTGYSLNQDGSTDYATVKHDGDSGEVLWANIYNGARNESDYGTSVAITSNGDVVVTGISRENNAASDYTTLKYAGSDGAELWRRSYDGPDHGPDVATKVIVDSADNVVVSGYSANAINYDYLTVKYAGVDGTALWDRRHNGPADGFDYAYDVAVTSTDDVVVTGRSRGGDSGPDYATLKYASSTGADLWISRYNGPGNTEDTATALVLTSIDDVVVTGRSVSSDGSDEYATVKYAAANGAELWGARYNASSDEDQAAALAVTADDDIVVAGLSGGTTHGDFEVVKFSGADGAALWHQSHDFGANGLDYAYSIMVAQDGSLRVAGTAETLAGRRIGVLNIGPHFFRDGFEAPPAIAPAATDATAATRGHSKQQMRGLNTCDKLWPGFDHFEDAPLADAPGPCNATDVPTQHGH